MKNIYGPIRGKCPIHTDTISNYDLIIKVSSNFYLPALTHILILQSCGKLGRRGRVGTGQVGLGVNFYLPVMTRIFFISFYCFKLGGGVGLGTGQVGLGWVGANN